MTESYIQKLTKSWPKLVQKVNQKLIKVRAWFGSIMDRGKCTFPIGITSKMTSLKGTQYVLQKLIKSWLKLDTKVDPKLPRKVNQKLPEIGFQKLSKSCPKLDIKVRKKLTRKLFYFNFVKLDINLEFYVSNSIRWSLMASGAMVPHAWKNNKIFIFSFEAEENHKVFLLLFTAAAICCIQSRRPAAGRLAVVYDYIRWQLL